MTVDFKNLEAAHAIATVAWRAQFDRYCVELQFSDQEREFIVVGPEKISVTNEESEKPNVTLIASHETWAKFCQKTPPVGYHSLGAMIEMSHIKIETDDIVDYTRKSLLLEQMFATLRETRPVRERDYAVPELESISGRYLRINLNGRAHRIYFEEAGQGTPLICLHTAGADGRQFRDILNDPEITKNHRVIAFDLPWHGKSSPPAGFEKEVYTLTTDQYVDIVVRFAEALKIENPIVMGCSIGGRAVLHLALRHPEKFKAMIGLQSATYSESRMVEELGLFDKHTLFRPDVHPESCLAGLQQAMSPNTPSSDFWETLWHYAQGGPGVFLGDLYYYVVDGDMRNGVAEQIDTSKIPIHLLTGEYDLSATPEMTMDLARMINATSVKIMEGLGHFPMSEDPVRFNEYLMPVLEEIASQEL